MRKYRLGVLWRGEPESFRRDFFDAFLRALAPLGYAPGSNLDVEFRFASITTELDALAVDLVGQRVDAILTAGTPATMSARRATRDIPIITSVGDPVSAGFARDLRQPGGNVTGLSQNTGELARKQIEVLRLIYPKLSEIAILFPAGYTAKEAVAKPILDAAREASLPAALVPFTDSSLGERLDDLKRRRVEGIIAGGLAGPLLEPAFARRIGVMGMNVGQAEDGCLAAIQGEGHDEPQVLAAILDKVFRGENPARIPFVQPTRYVLVINAKTAAALRLRLPEDLLLRADRVIR